MANNPTSGSGSPADESRASYDAQAACGYAPDAAGAQQAQSAYAQQSYAQQPYAQQPYAYAQQPYAYAQPAPESAPKKRFGAGTWIVLGILLFLIVFTFTIGAMSCSSAVSTLTESSEMSITTTDTVAVITLDGDIAYDGSACSPEGLSALLEEAENDPNIKAVVLRIDSGGGTSTAGEEMAEYVKRFSKPIVVSSASMNASAAYEISSQADWIFVNESTAIGSIGTAMQFYDLSELLDTLGISIDNITSAESKDSSYGTRPLTDEEREYYQALVDAVNESFIETVAEGRGMDVEDVRELATGLQFTGTEAVENGLADEIGIYEDALDKAAELGGIEGDYDVVDLTDSSSDLSSIIDLLADAGDSSTESEDDATAEALALLLDLLENEGVLS